MDKFWQTISFIGSVYVYAFFMILLFFFDSSWLFLVLFWMLCITTGIALIIKFFWKTSRPRKAKKVRWWWQKIAQSAFPSAHTARAVALFVIAIIWSNLTFQILAGIFMILVMFSRIKLRAHYWRDIVGGIILGILAGIAAFYLTHIVADWLAKPEVIIYEIN